LEFSVAELNYNHKDRADTLVGVTKYLKQVQAVYQGSSQMSRLKKWAEAAKPSDAYMVGVRGFGLSGFQYLRILLGAQTVKPDVHIRRFVSEAVGHSVSDERSIELFEAAGKYLDKVSGLATHSSRLRGLGPAGARDKLGQGLTWKVRDDLSATCYATSSMSTT
jgi:hypothetical protein